MIRKNIFKKNSKNYVTKSGVERLNQTKQITISLTLINVQGFGIILI